MIDKIAMLFTHVGILVLLYLVMTKPLQDRPKVQPHNNRRPVSRGMKS